MAGQVKMQLLLPVSINASQTFDSFVNSEDAILIEQLHKAVDSSEFASLYIAGAQGTGKSHLLNACCHRANEINKTSILLPLEQMLSMSAQVLDGVENIDLVCIDNIELIKGNMAWQKAIFNLYNSLMQSHATLVITGSDTSNNLALELPDLASRLQWSTPFQLHQLSEQDKTVALTHHAHLMGFELSEDVAKFMLSRLPRKMDFLMQALNTLAKQSIEKQRVVTVPFVKEVLEI